MPSRDPDRYSGGAAYDSVGGEVFRATSYSLSTPTPYLFGDV